MSEPRLSKVTITLFWLSLLGVWAVLLVTKRWGLGLTPESIVYVQSAKHFVSGQGLSIFSGSGTLQPLTSHPPLFPFVLTWGWFLGMDPYTWARFLNAALFGSSIFLAGILAFNATRALKSAVLASLLVLCSLHILESHIMLVAEPLLLAGTLGFFLALSLSINSRSRRSFYAAALLAATIGITHTIGVLVILTGVVSYYLLTSGTRKERGARALFFGLSAFLPLALWVDWKVVNGFQSARFFRFHWPSLEAIYSTVNSVSTWFLPKQVPDVLRWLLLGLVIGVVIVLFKKFKDGKQTAPSPAALSLILFIGIALLGLMFKMFSSAGSCMFGQRGPILVWAAMLVLVVVSWPGLRRQNGWGHKLQQIGVAALVIFMALTLARAMRYGAIFFKNGAGYSSKVWAESQVVKNLRALDDVPVYTNDPSAFYYLTGRPAVFLPRNRKTGCFCSSAKMINDFQGLRALAVIFFPSERNRLALEQIPSDVTLVRLMGDGVADIYGMQRQC